MSLKSSLPKSLLAGVLFGAVALVTSAHAADLTPAPIYKAPLVPVPWSWTGIYIGGDVGGIWSRSSVTDDPSTIVPVLGGRTTTVSGSSVLGGVEAGANLQIYHVVLGLEGDFGWASIKRTAPAPSIFGAAVDTFSSQLNTLGTVRGRLGWAFDRVLLYTTGGAAFAQLNYQFIEPVTPFIAGPNQSITYGYTIGGGIEYAFLDHWSAKAEYLYIGFPNRTSLDNAGIGFAFLFKDYMNIGRVGINYKF